MAVDVDVLSSAARRVRVTNFSVRREESRLQLFFLFVSMISLYLRESAQLSLTIIFL